MGGYSYRNASIRSAGAGSRTHALCLSWPFSAVFRLRHRSCPAVAGGTRIAHTEQSEQRQEMSAARRGFSAWRSPGVRRTCGTRS